MRRREIKRERERRSKREREIERERKREGNTKVCRSIKIIIVVALQGGKEMSFKLSHLIIISISSIEGEREIERERKKGLSGQIQL